MVDVQGIYERFCSAPLRLRSKTAPSPPPPSSRPLQSSTDAASVAGDIVSETPPKGRRTRQTAKAMEQLNDRIESDCRLEAATTTGTKRARVTRGTSANTEAKTAAKSSNRKQKRDTRLVPVLNADTGGVFMDTPTKSAAPPKRSRKSTKSLAVQEAEDGDNENRSKAVSVSRNIMDELAGADEDMDTTTTATTTSRPKPRRNQATRSRPSRAVKPVPEGVRHSRRLRTKEEQAVGQKLTEAVQAADPEQVEAVFEAVVSPVEQLIRVESDFCKPLLGAKTTSGTVSALWFSAIGRELAKLEGDTVEIVESVRLLFAACDRMSHCEVLARKHSSAPTAEEATVSISTKKKRVEFRHFDLSSLDLRYIEDESAARMVETLLGCYSVFISHVVELWERSQLYKQSKSIGTIIAIVCDTEKVLAASTANATVREAFEGMSAAMSAEVRVCQTMFATEFDKLVQPRVTSPPLLESWFSPMFSSLVRYRLRYLFLPFEHSDISYGKMKIAKYEHQDVGAAVHRSLRDMHSYRAVVAPVIAVATFSPSTSDADRELEVERLLLSADEDEREQVEQYILVCRFVRRSWSACVLQEIDMDEETRAITDQIERLCTLAKSLQFEDEAHLFPLESIETLVEHLTQLEPSLAVVERVLEAVRSPQHGTETPCVECNELVTRAQASASIACASCKGQFHLQCLRLPASFAQFASNYTCPFCYVGKKR